LERKGNDEPYPFSRGKGGRLPHSAAGEGKYTLIKFLIEQERKRKMGVFPEARKEKWPTPPSPGKVSSCSKSKSFAVRGN